MLTLPRGHRLFHEGLSASSAFVIESGVVALTRHTLDGAELTVAVAGPGQLIGEHALRREPAVAGTGAVAVGSVSCRVLSPGDVDAARAATPAFDAAVIDALSELTRQLATFALDTVHASADERVRRRLATLASIFDDGSRPVDIPVTQEQLASITGVTRQTVNRVLRAAHADGVLTLQWRRISIVDPSRLAVDDGTGSALGQGVPVAS